MPAGGIINSLAQTSLSNKDLDRVFIEQMDMWESEYTKFTKPSSTGDRYIKEGEMAALGPLVYKPEGSSKSIEGIKQGLTKTITFKDYSLVTVLTEQAQAFDKTGITKKIPEFLARSAQYALELDAVTLLTGAFVTTFRTGVDGFALCADAHTILDPWTGATGATYDNNGTAAALSASSLAAARDYFENLANSKGLPVHGGRRLLLIVGPYLRDTAKLLLENEYEVDSADRNMNINKNTMQYMVSHYLGATNNDYFVVDLDLYDLRHIWSKQFSSKVWDDNWTDNKAYGITL